MSGNIFGHMLRYISWGESHGPAIGCVVEGVPPKIPLSVADIQQALDRRKPGTSRFTTQRQEDDEVHILSGVFEGLTTGTPISLIVYNQDQRSKDYSEIKDKFRPGHADYTYDKKYGIRDYRGGGRASARETIARCAAGAIAKRILEEAWGTAYKVCGALTQIGTYPINKANWDWQEVNRNSFFTPDSEIIADWETLLTKTRKEGSSLGAYAEVHAFGVPVGLGAPVYDKLDADLAKALLSVNAVKGIEIGDGFAASLHKGEENADELFIDANHQVQFKSNHAGGILGGISTGQEIIVKCALKPTSSILKPLETITTNNQNCTISTKGRHDPCVGIRAIPILEAMVHLVLADHWLRHKAQCL